MSERRSKSELAAAVLAACKAPMTEREIQDRIRAPGSSTAPNVRNLIRGMLTTGELQTAGVRHTLERGGETLFITVTNVTDTLRPGGGFTTILGRI